VQALADIKAKAEKEADDVAERLLRQVPGLDDRNVGAPEQRPRSLGMCASGQHDRLGPALQEGADEVLFARQGIFGVAEQHLQAGGRSVQLQLAGAADGDDVEEEGGCGEEEVGSYSIGSFGIGVCVEAL